jgi:hypothetical protein
MNAPEHDPGCHETYRQCTADRMARVRSVIADNPDATKAELAALAGVHPLTIQRARNPKGDTPVSPLHHSPRRN